MGTADGTQWAKLMGPNGRRLWDPMGETFGTQWAKFMGPNGQKAHALNSTLLQLAHWMLKHLCWFAALRNMIVTTRRSVTKLVHVLSICMQTRCCQYGACDQQFSLVADTKFERQFRAESRPASQSSSIDRIPAKVPANINHQGSRSITVDTLVLQGFVPHHGQTYFHHSPMFHLPADIHILCGVGVCHLKGGHSAGVLHEHVDLQSSTCLLSSGVLFMNTPIYNQAKYSLSWVFLQYHVGSLQSVRAIACCWYFHYRHFFAACVQAVYVISSTNSSV